MVDSKRTNPNEERAVKGHVITFMKENNWRVTDVAIQCDVSIQSLRYWAGNVERRLRPATLQKVIAWLDSFETP